MDIGKKISDIRLSKGFSAEHVAEKAEISIDLYNNIEVGIVDVTFKQLENIAEALEYEVVDIISYQETIRGIRNYFYNNNGNSGTNIHVQGVDQEQIRKAYKELYIEELSRIPKLEKLLKDNNIDFSF